MDRDSGRHVKPRSTSIDDVAGSDSYALAAAYLLASVALGLHFFQGPLANAILIGILLVLVVGRLSGSRTELIAHDWMYLLYFSFALMSVIWSISPLDTGQQALPMIVPWLATFLLVDLREQWVCRFIVLTGVAASVLSVMMVFVSGRLAYQPVSSTGAPELRGIFAHQLFLGTFLTIALGLIAVSYFNGELNQVVNCSRSAKLAIVILLVSVLVLSRTRLYVVAGVLALVLTWLLSKTSSRRMFAVSVLSLAGLAITLTFGATVQYLERQNFDLTLTGRTNVWEKTLNAVEGAAAFWDSDLEPSSCQRSTSSSTISVLATRIILSYKPTSSLVLPDSGYSSYW